MKQWFNGLSDQWKATLRTAWQNFLGTIITLALLLLAKATDWVNGGAVDWVQELSNAGRLLVIGLITLFSSVVTFIQNRGYHGATYFPPPVGPKEDKGQAAYNVVWWVVGVLLIIVLFVWLTRNVNI